MFKLIKILFFLTCLFVIGSIILPIMIFAQVLVVVGTFIDDKVDYYFRDLVNYLADQCFNTEDK